MSFLPRKENGKVDVKAMWEYKLIRFVIMFFVYLMLLIYSIAGAQSVWKWSQLRYYGGDYSLEHLPAAIESLKTQDNQLLLIEYISRFPGERYDQMIEELMPMTPDLHAHVFFAIANRYGAVGQMDEAMFWGMLGRYRLRFDALRCDYLASDRVSNLYAEAYLQPYVRTPMRELSENARKEVLQEVLNWVEKYPAENDPSYFCQFIQEADRTPPIDVVEPKGWPIVHEIMRDSALRYINSETSTKLAPPVGNNLPTADDQTDTDIDMNSDNPENQEVR